MPTRERRHQTPNVNFLCPRELKDRLDAMAAREHTTVSAVIKRACPNKAERDRLQREREAKVYGSIAS